jgi:hypothetical protein
MNSSRRSFLRRVGWGAASLVACTPLLEAGSARARSDRPPRRLVALFTPNGTILDEFFAPTSDGSVQLGRILQPLAPFREDLLLLDGLTMGVTAIAPGNEHQRGMAAWLTGQPNAAGDFCGGDACISGRSGWATAASIDQLVATRHFGATPISSLELAVRLEGTNNRHRMSYSGAEQPIAPDPDPRSVYKRLFGLSADKLDSQIAITQLLSQQYKTLHQQVSVADRARLQAHLASVESIEQRLRMVATKEHSEAAVSEPLALDTKAAENYAELTRLQLDMLVAALRTDATRVASLMWSGATAKVLPVWLNGQSYSEFPFQSPMSADFHSHTHEPYVDPSDPQQAEVRHKLLSIYRWYAEAIAGLLRRMQEVVEPDGSTLLDNTLVIWGSELASPNIHTFDRMPFVVAGGSKFLKTGRYLDSAGQQHTALLATLGLAFGLPDEPFGHPDFARAPLYELLR